MNHHEQVISVLKETFKDQPIRGIEIGTAGGDLTKSLLLFLSNLEHIFTIDPWRHREKVEFEASLPQEVLDAGKFNAYKSLIGYKQRVTILALPSDDAAKIIPQEKVDFVWIDGDHTLDQVKRDILNYMPLVRSGGILGGHDYYTILPVIQEIFNDKVSKGADMTWWLIKDGNSN